MTSADLSSEHLSTFEFLDPTAYLFRRGLDTLFTLVCSHRLGPDVLVIRAIQPLLLAACAQKIPFFRFKVVLLHKYDTPKFPSRDYQITRAPLI
ncbi:hypothetical protein RSAG8_06372, partial [Rhizoctonia solani AG-8 WAC10335]